MTATNNMKAAKWLTVAFAAGLLVSFFLPWVMWKDAALSGNAMPAGQFFTAAKDKFGVDNPFPQISFAFKIFWLIPLSALAVIAFTLMKKNILWPAIVAGLLSLSLALVYFLFSKSMVDQLGVSESAWSMTKPWLFITVITAVAVVLTAANGRWLLKTGLILGTVAATVIGFTIVSKKAEKKIFDETFTSIENIKADYTVTATGLINEFMANDSLANQKYREKIVSVSGITSAVKVQGDSTVNIEFADSTGSYIVFPMEKGLYQKASTVKQGDVVSLKGSCSGSLYSDILGITSISFKRTTFNKQ
ncbi:MAG: hypothetical protein HOP10_08720 [Chitinophagaceae bacterium]|nr:hypothetical protein [Chitinophagaceae bacterium]